MILSSFWCHVLESVVSSLISGVILIALGVCLYKRIRKKQTIQEAIIDKELKIQYVVNEFRRMREEYTKPLAEGSMSSQIEQELSDLYGCCNDIIELSEQFNLPVDSDLRLLMNHSFAQKAVLYCNNPVQIANEKIPIFQNLKNMKINLNKDAGRSKYFKDYSEYDTQIKNLIKSKKFLKRYWR